VSDMDLRRRLRSATTTNLVVPRFKRSTLGGRAFPVAGAHVWNALPSHVTSSSSRAMFESRLRQNFSSGHILKFVPDVRCVLFDFVTCPNCSPFGLMSR